MYLPAGMHNYAAICYFQIELDDPTLIRGIISQGRNGCCKQWVTRYRVLYSLDCKKWNTLGGFNVTDAVSSLLRLFLKEIGPEATFNVRHWSTVGSRCDVRMLNEDKDNFDKIKAKTPNTREIDTQQFSRRDIL